MPTLSDTSRVQISYVEEVTQGTTPNSALTNVRVTTGSLTANTTTTADDELRSDRQFVNAILTDIEPAASLGFALSYNNINEFLEGALFSDWTTAIAISATDLSAANADNSYNSVTTDFTAENISAGQWIKVAGFTDSANNGLCKVVSVAATKLIVSGLTLANESAGDTVTMSGSMLRNGTTRHFYSLEAKFADVTEFMYVKGAMVSSLALDLTSASLATGSLEFMGLSAGMQATTIGNGSYTAAPTNDIFNTVGNVANILEDGSAMAAPVQSLSVTVDNALRTQKAVGTLGNYGIGAGRCGVSGSLSVYFINSDLFDDVLANTAKSLSWRLTDGDGNIYIFTLPNVRFSAGDPDVGGVDSDVIQAIDFTAIRDATTDCTIQIDKIPA